MSDEILSLKHVEFAYQKVPVLRDVTFSIDAGELIGIIGPNGGGKTTLLKLIMGFFEPSKGEIQLLGKNPVDIQAEIAYVPQMNMFDRQFPLSTMELVLGGLINRLPWHGQFRKEERLRAEQAIEQVGLQDLHNRSFGALSGGQAKRALIARALVSNPQILLLDEPTAMVDAKAESMIYDVINELKGTLTILMVNHDLQAIIDNVERVFCVQGEVSTLPPEKVCEHFAVGLYHKPLINKDQHS